MMANITFLSFLLFSMCHSIHVAVNTWLNCSFFTLMSIIRGLLSVTESVRGVYYMSMIRGLLCMTESVCGVYYMSIIRGLLCMTDSVRGVYKTCP